MSIMGWGVPICQQLHLYEDMRIQEINAKQKQLQIRGGISTLEANVCVLTRQFFNCSICYCGNALFTDNFWLSSNDVTS